jgi:hypothetical protein
MLLGTYEEIGLLVEELLAQQEYEEGMITQQEYEKEMEAYLISQGY